MFKLFAALNLSNFITSAKFTVFLAPIIAFFTPVSHLLAPLFFLMLIDVTTGLYKSRLKGIKITSRRFIANKPKIVILWALGLITVLLADMFLADIKITGNWSAKIYCIFYGLYEVLSILENLAESGLKGASNISRLLKGKLPAGLASELEKKDDNVLNNKHNNIKKEEPKKKEEVDYSKGLRLVKDQLDTKDDKNEKQ